MVAEYPEDAENDRQKIDQRDGAEIEGLRACWSNPVMTATGDLLGTFGTYYRQPRIPDETSQRRLRQAAALVALAIVRDRDTTVFAPWPNGTVRCL